MHRYVSVISLFLFFIDGFSQGNIRCQLIDSLTKQPVPFANVAVTGKTLGTTSDINGYFGLAYVAPDDRLQISCIGYKTIAISCSELQTMDVLMLVPQPYSLLQIDVFPTKNVAFEVMEKVLDHRNRNNPDESTDYKCIVYHKMTFRYLGPDSLADGKKMPTQHVATLHDQHLMLIESVSEKKHQRPGKFSEKLITGRVSGLTEPVLAILPAQIQPFAFYNERLELLGKEFLNPLSPMGLKEYLFVLEDTLFDAGGDVLYYISFSPKKNANISGMSGTFHIHAATWGIKSVAATTISEGTPYVLSIRQNYRLVDGRIWFPEQLESSLRILSVPALPKSPYPLLAEGKSYVMGVDLSPRFSPNEFSSTVLRDETYKNNAPSVDAYRYVPLSRTDSLTYRIVDSLGRKVNLDKMVQFQKNLLHGYIPVGPMKLDYRKLVDYSSYQGWKLGIGLATGESVSQRIDAGGYFVHAFGINENMYGGSFDVHLSKEHQAKFSLEWKNDYAETGAFSFLDGFKMFSPESFRKYLSESMDRNTTWIVAAESRLGGGWKARLQWTGYEIEPRIPYRFVQNPMVGQAFSGHEGAIQFRWRPGETYTWSPLGLFANSANGPVLWANIRYGELDGPSRTAYYKAEGQGELTTNLTASRSVSFRLTAGGIWGDYNSTLLYSGFGTYKQVGLEIPHSFSTMRMNEFAADRFALFSFAHEWAFNLNKKSSFKPRLVFTSKAGWADASRASSSITYPIFSFRKGYFESGLSLHDLLRHSFIRYGVGVHYRYGPYAFDRVADNFALNLLVGFALQ
ncbi:MAG: DUF5686 family protein [Breznakibacter sp.]